MRALLVSLALLGACEGAKPEPRIELITKKSHRDARAPDEAAVSCTRVLDQISRALFAYDPQYVSFASMYAPKLRASCTDDGWPDELKRCIVDATPDALAHDHACEKLVTPELAEKVAKRFGASASGLSFGR